MEVNTILPHNSQYLLSWRHCPRDNSWSVVVDSLTESATGRRVVLVEGVESEVELSKGLKLHVKHAM